MTYIVSDLCGHYQKFCELLNTIGFTDDDVMYVLGNVTDYGDEPMPLLCDLSMRANVLPILGDGDYKAYRFLSAVNGMLEDGSAPDAELMADMARWMTEGGQNTLTQFRELDSEMREGVLDYLSDMALYEEITVKGQKYLLVHAGIAGFDPDTPLEDYMPEDFISEPLDMEREYFEDVTVIVGHVPAASLPDADEGMIYYGEGSINVNGNVAGGGKLFCLCLETGKEYYV